VTALVVKSLLGAARARWPSRSSKPIGAEHAPTRWGTLKPVLQGFQLGRLERRTRWDTLEPAPVVDRRWTRPSPAGPS
jgi:hypothetical protein